MNIKKNFIFYYVLCFYGCITFFMVVYGLYGCILFVWLYIVCIIWFYLLFFINNSSTDRNV